MFYLYILYSISCNRTYTGITSNPDRRLKQHNSNQNRSTKNCEDWVKIYYEEYETRTEARSREKYFKSSTGRREIKLILQNYLNGKSN